MSVPPSAEPFGWPNPSNPPSPPAPPPGSPSATGPRRRHRGLFWSGVLVAVAALVAGAVVAVTSYLGSSTPGGVVTSYLDAVARSDAPAALAYGDLPDGPRGWLTSDVLRAQNAVAPMSDITVISTSPGGDTRKVNVQYTLSFPAGPRTVVDTISVTREGRTWRLTKVAVPVRIELSAATQHVRFAGAALPTGTELLFPGALPLTFDVAALTLAPDNQVVRFANGGLIDAEVQVTKQAARSITEAVGSALTACLTGSAKVEPLCPLPTGERAVPGTLRGTATSPVASAVKLAVADGGAGTIDISGTVHVSGTYQRLDFNNLASNASGNQLLDLDARCRPSAPTRIMWGSG